MNRWPNVSKLERRGDLAGLSEAVSFRRMRATGNGPHDAGARVRLEAVAALAHIEEPQSTAALAQATSDSEASVRSAALGALTGRSDPAAVDALADAALGETFADDPSGRDQAVQALADQVRASRGDAARRTVTRYLDVEREVAPSAHESVGRVLEAERPDARREILEDVVQTADGLEEAGRARAATLLAAHPDDSRDVLLSAVRDPRLQVPAAQALGAMRESAAVPPLLDMLRADGATTRAVAARALGQVQDPRAAEGLLEALEDRDPKVREAATGAVQMLGPAALWGFASAARTLSAPGSPDLADSARLLAGSTPPSQAVRPAERSAPEDEPRPSPEPAEPVLAGGPSEPIEPPGPPSQPSAPPRHRRRRQVLAAGAAVGLAALAVGIAVPVLDRSGDESETARQVAASPPASTADSSTVAAGTIVARRQSEAARAASVHGALVARERARTAAEERRARAARRADSAPEAAAAPAEPAVTPAPTRAPAAEAPPSAPVAPPQQPAQEPAPPQPAPEPEPEPQLSWPEPGPAQEPSGGSEPSVTQPDPVPNDEAP